MGQSTAVIASGQSQSNALDISDQAVVGIQLPSAWTTAAVTLLGSATESGTYVPVYDAAGVEVSISAAASRWVALNPAAFRFRWLKLRSGTNGTPVNQGAERRIEVLFAAIGV